MFQSKKGKELSEKLERITDFMILSLIWCVYSLPIITIGAATSALYYTTIKSIKEKEGYILKHFHKSFKNSFKQATIVWSIFLLIVFVLRINQRLILNGASVSWINQGIQFFLLVILLAYIPLMYFSFAYISRFEDTLRTVILNNLAFLFYYKKRAIMMLFSILFVSLITYWVPLVIVLFPAMSTFFFSEYIEEIYSQYIKSK